MLVASLLTSISSKISTSERAGRQDPDHVFRPGTESGPENAENVILLNRAVD